MKVCNDPETLLPGFRERVMVLLEAMRWRGWNPMLYETRRSPERAAMLAKRGTGSASSMHCLDAAADIVDADRDNVDRVTSESLWHAPPQFWADLEDIAESLGLVRLYKRGVTHDATDGNAESWDMPHVQACEVSEQSALRAMSRDERAEWCRAKFPPT